MPFLKRFARGEFRLDRIEAFSDGVFAITPLFFIVPPRFHQIARTGPGSSGPEDRRG